MSEVKVNKLSPRSGTTVTLGDSGDTFAITSGASISGFTSTGIDDNATSTAITIDSSENVDIVGTTTSSNFISDGTGYGIKFPLNGTATLNTSSNSVIFTGSGSSGDYLAGTLNLQSRGNLDRDINLITGATASKTLTAHGNGDIAFYEDTGTTPKFYWDASTERLGIGTTSPSNLLDVKASSNNEDVIRISHPSSPTAAGALLGFNSDGTTDNNVVTLGIHYSSDFYDVLNIQRSTRNVGIGTVNPQQQLDISSNVPRIRFTDLSVTNLRHVIGSEANDLEIRCDDGNVQASSHIGFKIDGNEKVRITDAGDVGIGTTSPDSILDLTSTPNNNFIHFNATTGGSNGDIIGGFEVNNTGGTIGKLTVHRESTSSSGYMAFQTGTSEKMRIQNNGNVGIGTISPAHNLEIVATNSGSINDTLQIRNNTTTTGSGSRIRFITSTDLNSDTNGASIASVRNGNDNDLVFEVENSEAMRIDHAGRVGIGTTSPNSISNLHVADAYASEPMIRIETSDSGNKRLDLYVSGGQGYVTSRQSGQSLNFDATSNLIFKTVGSERMRLTSNGQFLFGKTSAGTGVNGIEFETNGKAVVSRSGTAGGTPMFINRNDNDGTIIIFKREDVEKGSISISGSTTSYNTSSDYRLKENVSYDFDATTRLKQLRPARFNFIADADTTVDGFLAHEVQSVIPEAITGTKDAVKEDGTPDYQGIDQAKLVPLLVKTIQELEARITTLENA